MRCTGNGWIDGQTGGQADNQAGRQVTVGCGLWDGFTGGWPRGRGAFGLRNGALNESAGGPGCVTGESDAGIARERSAAAVTLTSQA